MSEQHKHAAVLRDIANGVNFNEFEFNFTGWLDKTFICLTNASNEVFINPKGFNIRRKQKTHVVNGFTVPEPLRDEPLRNSMYFIEEPSAVKFYSNFRWDSDFDKRCMKRGIVHATKEGAIANCKARLGIDPYKDDQCSD